VFVYIYLSFSTDGEDLSHILTPMIRLDPIYVKSRHSEMFTLVLFVGVYVGRLRSNADELVSLPTEIPNIQLPFLRMYNLLVSVYVDQPNSSFVELFNIIRAQAFNILLLTDDVDVHFLPQPIRASSDIIEDDMVDVSTQTEQQGTEASVQTDGIYAYVEPVAGVAVCDLEVQTTELNLNFEEEFPELNLAYSSEEAFFDAAAEADAFFASYLLPSTDMEVDLETLLADLSSID
jgi:hypothetical protein